MEKPLLAEDTSCKEAMMTGHHHHQSGELLAVKSNYSQGSHESVGLTNLKKNLMDQLESLWCLANITLVKKI